MNFAAPLVPSRLTKIEALQWRVDLLKKYSVIDIRAFLNDFKLHMDGQLSEAKVGSWIDLANETLILDEVDKVLVVVTGWLLGAQTMSPLSVAYLDPILSLYRKEATSDEAFVKKYCADIERHRENLLSIGRIYLSKELPEIRAKIAARELIAMLNWDVMFPKLIADTVRYLQCPTVNRWLELTQHVSCYGEKGKKSKAITLLKEVSKSMVVDRNALKTKQHSRWAIFFRYSDIVSRIEGFRTAYQNRRNEPFDLEFFTMYCDHAKVDELYRRHMLADQMTAREIALATMIKNGHVKSENSFNRILADVNQMRDKHPLAEVTSIAHRFFDLGSFAPEQMSSLHLWRTLELIKIESAPSSEKWV